MKINKKLSLVFVLAFGIPLGILFQNMASVEFATLNMPPIDEKARREQAQELLGNHYYYDRTMQNLENQKDLNYLVYKKLKSSMAPEWQKWIPEITKELIKECQKQDMDPVFVLAIIQTESRFNTYAKGTSGEIGLMQILPQTAEWIAGKYKLEWRGPNSLYDPITNIKVGITYFAHLRVQFDSRARHYVPAYNMGPTNLKRIARSLASIGLNDDHLLNGEYGSRVLNNYKMIYEQMIY